jgi:hypothetical protein
LDRVTVSEAVGRAFESRRAHFSGSVIDSAGSDACPIFY